MSARELSLAAGCDQGYVSRLERGKGRAADLSLRRILRMTAALDVPVEAVLRDCAAGWQIGSWLNPEPVERFLAEMRAAENCVTCTQGIESYLLPDEMAIFLGRRFHERIGYDELRLSRWLDWATGYRLAQHALRRSTDFVHCVVAPDRDFREATVRAQGWLDATSRILDQYEDFTAVGFVPPRPFADLSWQIAEIIGVPNWDKVTIVDDLVAMVRPSRDVYLLSYQPDTVEQLRRAIDHVAGAFVPYSFPQSRTAGLEECRTAARHAVRHLRQLCGK